MTIENLLSENQDLKSFLLEKEGLVHSLEEKLASYARYNGQLEEAVRLLRLKKFAPTSEKLVLEEEQLVFNEIEVLAASVAPEDESEQAELIEVPSHMRKKPKRKVLPKELPRERVVIDLAEDQKICPHDGSRLKVTGEETSERLDVIPLQMKVIETARLTYGCDTCKAHMKTAPVVPQVVPKGLPTAGTLAFIATSKFVDGLSLYHIEEIFGRNGVDVSRGSMAHWMIRASNICQPLINLLDEELIASDYVHMDETTTQVLNEPGKKAQTKSYMWVRARSIGKPIVIFEYDPSRSGKVATRLMHDFKGKLQCDGYGGYNELERKPFVVRVGCWAHSRRKFFDAIKAAKGANLAKRFIALIKKLYLVEDEVRGMQPEDILKIRAEKSTVIIAEIKKLLKENLHLIPPKSLTGKALHYLNNEWQYLVEYLEDGRVHIDNNFIENKIRPFAIGRKRWLFSDSVDGAKASAILYSLVETAKANNVEPYKYLRHIFEKLPLAQRLPDFEALLPWNMKIEKV